MIEISIQEYLENASSYVLLDVRQKDEYDFVHIPNSVHIPLADIAKFFDELVGYNKPIACLCHHGRRSLQAAGALKQQGITAVSIKGGIDVWAEKFDPSLKRY